jgi:hypothetical protein
MKLVMKRVKRKEMKNRSSTSLITEVINFVRFLEYIKLSYYYFVTRDLKLVKFIIY